MTSVAKRRRFLAAGGVWIVASAVGPAVADEHAEAGQGGEGEEEVTPPEDLMREHGVLRRILLIYDEILWRRLAHDEEFPPEVLAASAEIVRGFEDYHEKLEEDYVVPRFRKAGKSVELVDTLLAQHRAGRVLTDAILHRANARALKDPGERAKLMASLRLFARMYRPHAAREDTVLYPQLCSVVSRHEFDALGDEFENNERKLFGEEGFEGVVGRVAGLEKKLGVYDLASFTAS
jgi:hemerythrin-like domain-containing protein